MIITNNLIAGRIVRGKQFEENISPIDGKVVSQVNYLSGNDLIAIFKKNKGNKNLAAKEEYGELTKLAQFISKNHNRFINQIIIDAGFTIDDARDLVDGSIEFCKDYHLYIKQITTEDITSSFSYKKQSTKKITLTSSPYGLIAATTPRNTPLITELIIVAHALWSGNVLVLRPSYGVAGTITLLIEGLLKSFNSETLASLNIVFSNAKDFVGVSLDYVNLLHYIGSTKYLEQTLVAGIKKGVKVLVDGDGCSMVIVDATANIEEAVKACYQGLIRCNGQICISVRVIIVEQTVYEKFWTLLLAHIKKTRVQPPALEKQSDMGPLFSAAQVENIIAVAEKYKVLHGELRSLSYGSNYVAPIVLSLKPNDRNFLRENLFGPMVGIAYYKGEEWKGWLMENPINLTDVVFSGDQKFISEFLAISKSPRRVVNADPTLESVFEPWGAFLPSGWNDVSHWYYKYRSYYQLVQE